MKAQDYYKQARAQAMKYLKTSLSDDGITDFVTWDALPRPEKVHLKTANL